MFFGRTCGSSSAKYSARPGWLMSCHDLRSVEERTDNLDERRDSDLRLAYISQYRLTNTDKTCV